MKKVFIITSIVTSTLATIAFGLRAGLFGFAQAEVKPEKEKIYTQSKEYSTTITILCPVVGEGKPSDPVGTAADLAQTTYEHCSRCNTGVFLPHGENKEISCTFCGAKK
jgi:ribosomal protein S27AE